MKKMFSIAAGVLFVSILGSGCASTRQYVPLPDQSRNIENPDKGRLYVMRPSLISAEMRMSVSDSGRAIGMTGGKGYLCWERTPGKATIVGEAENRAKLVVDVQKGRVYYIAQYIALGGFNSANKLELVDEAKGKSLLRQCKPPKIVLPDASEQDASEQ